MIEAKPKSLPTVTQAKNIVVDHDSGSLSWTLSTGVESIKLDELVFIIDLPPQPNIASGYVLCSLREDAENGENPYELILTKTTNLPPALVKQYGIKEIPQHLRNDDSHALDIIVSTKSGTEMSLKFWETVLEPLLKTVINELGETTSNLYETLVTTSKESVKEFVSKLPVPDSKQRTIVFLSGDGGAVDLFNNYAGTESNGAQPTIAVIPHGTGNALFHSLHKPLYQSSGSSPLVHSLRTLFRGVSADLPLFRATFSPGSRRVNFTDGDESAKQDTEVSHLLGTIVASYGFHASIVYESDTPEYRSHGAKRFGMVAEKLLKESHPYVARVEVRRAGSSDFEVIPREQHGYVLSTLVSNLERTFAISPDSRPLDGQLRLVHFGAVGGERTMDVMMKAYDEGKHVNVEWDDGEAVGYEAIDEVRVTTHEEDERWRKVCIDGTIVELPREGNVSIKRVAKALFKVVVDSQVAEAQ